MWPCLSRDGPKVMTHGTIHHHSKTLHITGNVHRFDLILSLFFTVTCTNTRPHTLIHTHTHNLFFSSLQMSSCKHPVPISLSHTHTHTHTHSSIHAHACTFTAHLISLVLSSHPFCHKWRNKRRERDWERERERERESQEWRGRTRRGAQMDDPLRCMSLPPTLFSPSA